MTTMFAGCDVNSDLDKRMNVVTKATSAGLDTPPPPPPKSLSAGQSFISDLDEEEDVWQDGKKTRNPFTSSPPVEMLVSERRRRKSRKRRDPPTTERKVFSSSHPFKVFQRGKEEQ